MDGSKVSTQVALNHATGKKKKAWVLNPPGKLMKAIRLLETVGGVDQEKGQKDA